MSPLDNPIWHSLTTRHAHLAIGHGAARRYPPVVTPFVAVQEPTQQAAADLLDLVEPGERVGILSVIPQRNADWALVKEIEIHQYVWDRPQGEVEPDRAAVTLDEAHLDAMLELTALVYPAYFRSGTARLGHYVGIIEDERLCAMAGIRMAMDGYKELSAICTHPAHRGLGYASRLTRHLIHHVQYLSEVPFLHTESYNRAAKAVYEKLGFTLRQVLPFHLVDRVSAQA